MIAAIEAGDSDAERRLLGAVLASGRVGPDILQALRSPNTNVRGAAIQVVSALGVNAAPAAPEIARQLASEAREQWAYQLLLAAGNLRCQSDLLVPKIASFLSHKSDIVRARACEALAKHGKGATASKRVLLRLFKTGTTRDRDRVLIALAAIGIERGEAQTLAAHDVPVTPGGRTRLFETLLRFPDVCEHFLEQHRSYFSVCENRWDGDNPVLRRLFSSRNPKFKSLRDIVRKRSDLPSAMMVVLAEPAYIPVIRARQDAMRDTGYARFLDACARALGDSPANSPKWLGKQSNGAGEQWIGAANRENGGFRIGHGAIRTLITGSITMADGRVPVNPRIVLRDPSNGVRDMLAAEVGGWNARTGRFYFFVELPISAARAGQLTLHRTHQVTVAVEANGAATKTVTVHLDMPDLAVRLSPGHPGGDGRKP